MKYVEGAKKLFLDTGTRFPREVVWSVALLKYSAAKANLSLQKIDEQLYHAIAAASKDVMDGRHDDEVVVDVFQTGSGTGVNMNINEVIAELASTTSGKPVHPNDHINMGQSSNDVVPSAVRMAAVSLCRQRMLPSLDVIAAGLRRLERRTGTVYKSGRTHLRDATPVTMGQEFGAYADAFEHDRALVEEALKYVSELPIGGTAVGTGINTDRRFGRMVVEEVNKYTGLDFAEARNKFRAMRLLTDMVTLSSALKATALDLLRLCQDVRLMFSGPLTGLAEIELPTQADVAGSSIMPGKTNPVTVEACMLASSQVIGLDLANQTAATLGEFELSMGVPLIGYNVNLQVKLLSEALNKLSSLVLAQVVPHKERARRLAEMSSSLITALSPVVGYDKAAEIGKRLSHGLSIRDALRELGYKDNEIDKLLDLKKLVGQQSKAVRPPTKVGPDR